MLNSDKLVFRVVPVPSSSHVSFVAPPFTSSRAQLINIYSNSHRSEVRSTFGGPNIPSLISLTVMGQQSQELASQQCRYCAQTS